MIPAAELDRRIARLQAYLAEEGTDGALLLQNADLFYFTGTVQSGCLWVPAEGKALFLVRKEVGRARAESALPLVVPFGSPKELPSLLGAHGMAMPKRVGMELDVVPVALCERYRKVLPGAEVTDVTPAVRKVRMIKSPFEVDRMREAAVQVNRVWEHAREAIREGMSDIELAAELEKTARLEGHPAFVRMRAFNGEMVYAHVFSGPATAEPAYMDTPLGGPGPSPAHGQGAGWRRIGRNEPILVDFAGSRDGYLVDQTRTFSIGPLPDRLRKAHDDMLAVERRMTELVPSLPAWGEIYDECLSLAVSLGYADHFMGAKGSQVSFIGHGLGVEIDEYPFLARGFHDMRLEPGMTFAFEPKAVFPGLGAAGTENTFLVTEKGAERLTFTPEEPCVL
jgi:Xaa-Pro dipeptidase